MSAAARPRSASVSVLDRFSSTRDGQTGSLEGARVGQMSEGEQPAGCDRAVDAAKAPKGAGTPPTRHESLSWPLVGIVMPALLYRPNPRCPLSGLACGVCLPQSTASNAFITPHATFWPPLVRKPQAGNATGFHRHAHSQTIRRTGKTVMSLLHTSQEKCCDFFFSS